MKPKRLPRMFNTNLVTLLLFAIGAMPANVQVEWDDPQTVTNYVAGYYVYTNRPPATNYTVAGMVLAASTNVLPAKTLTLTNVTAGELNMFVTASNVWGESLPSEILRLPPTNREPMRIRVKITYPLTP